MKRNSKCSILGGKRSIEGFSVKSRSGALFTATKDGASDFLKLRKSPSLSLEEKLRLSRMEKKAFSPLELIVETAQKSVELNSTDALSLATAKLNGDGVVLTDEGKFLLAGEISYLANDFEAMEVYNELFNIKVTNSNNNIKVTNSNNNIKVTNSNNNIKVTNSNCNLKYIHNVIDIKDSNSLFNKESLKSFRIIQNNSKTVELDKTGVTIVLEEIWGEINPDSMIVEISDVIFNKYYTYIKDNFLSFKLNVFNNKTFYFIVINDITEIDWFNLSYTPSWSDKLEKPNYSISFTNYKYIRNNIVTNRILKRINKRILNYLYSYLVRIERSGKTVPFMLKQRILSLLWFESRRIENEAKTTRYIENLLNNRKFNDISVLNYIKDKSLNKAHKALNNEYLIDLAFNKPKEIRLSRFLDKPKYYKVNTYFGYNPVEFSCEKLSELSDEVFQEGGSLDKQLTSISEWNSIHRQFKGRLEEIASEFNDLNDSESFYQELEAMEDTINRNWDKMNEFVSEDNWKPSEIELAHHAPSASWRAKREGKPFSLNNKGDGKTADEIMEEIGSVKLPITSNSSSERKSNRSPEELAELKKQIEMDIKETEMSISKRKEGAKDFNEIPCNPRFKPKTMEIPLPSTGVMIVDGEEIELPRAGVLVVKREVYSFDLPNKEALLLQFKTNFYWGAIKYYIRRTMEDLKREENRVVEHPKTSFKSYRDLNGEIKNKKLVYKNWWYYHDQLIKQKELREREALKSFIRLFFIKENKGDKIINDFTPIKTNIKIKGGVL